MKYYNLTNSKLVFDNQYDLLNEIDYKLNYSNFNYLNHHQNFNTCVSIASEIQNREKKEYIKRKKLTTQEQIEIMCCVTKNQKHKDIANEFNIKRPALYNLIRNVRGKK